MSHPSTEAAGGPFVRFLASSLSSSLVDLAAFAVFCAALEGPLGETAAILAATASASAAASGPPPPATSTVTTRASRPRSPAVRAAALATSCERSWSP